MKYNTPFSSVLCLPIMVTALLCVFIFSGQIFAQDGLIKIADNIYSYADVKKMSPQNSFGANAGIVIGRDGILVVDTLISAKEAKRFIKDIRAVSDRPIRYVVNTHYHLDHTFGNSEFEKLGAIIISHTIDRKSLKKKGEGTLKNAKMFGLSEQDMEGTKIAYPSVTFNGSMQIDLGDQEVELLFKGASHTEGRILVYLPDKRVLFAGDILFTGYHPYIADGDIKGWTNVLDDIVKMDAVAIIPGHGPLSTKKDIADMREYLITFDKKAAELSAKSSDIDYIASELKKALPSRPEGDSLIKANIQGKYLKKTNAGT
jgi:cyclase